MRVHRCSSECANLSLSGLFRSDGELPELQSQRSSEFHHFGKYIIFRRLYEIASENNRDVFYHPNRAFPDSTVSDMDIKPCSGSNV